VQELSYGGEYLCEISAIQRDGPGGDVVHSRVLSNVAFIHINPPPDNSNNSYNRRLLIFLANRQCPWRLFMVHSIHFYSILYKIEENFNCLLLKLLCWNSGLKSCKFVKLCIAFEWEFNFFSFLQYSELDSSGSVKKLT